MNDDFGIWASSDRGRWLEEDDEEEPDDGKEDREIVDDR
jgi:hypothetical protein